jgi:uncharacterized protein YecT (DUF1311 family)
MALLTLTLCTFSHAQKKQADCSDTAETQMDLNGCAGSKAVAADQEMNRLYRKLLERYKADPAAVARFRSAQRAWLKYRDAQLSTYGREGWGSAEPMCQAGDSERLTLERIKWLKRTLDEVEGDICSYPKPEDYQK